jgi:hypothetical protein
VINHVAIVLVLNTIKARSLQTELIVAVGSRFHPANIRVGKPMRIEMRSIKDETRKITAHGFDRSIRCDKTKQLRIFPIVPKMKIVGDKYRLSSSEIKFND